MILYLIGGLAAATLLASGIASCEHQQKVSARAEKERVEAEFAGFVLEAKRKGEEQEKNAAAKEAKDRATYDHTVALLKGDVATRDAAILRLRDSPITRPDRSPVPIIACRPESAYGAGQELISVVEYRELQARAYDDARALTRLQEWVKATGHPVE